MFVNYNDVTNFYSIKKSYKTNYNLSSKYYCTYYSYFKSF